MKDKAVLPIIKQTEKDLTFKPEPKPKRKKAKRAKAPKYDLSEKAFAKQINTICGKKKKPKWPDEEGGT